MFGTIKTAYRAAQKRREAMNGYNKLRAMDERMLRDIGVTRAQIDEAMSGLRFRA